MDDYDARQYEMMTQQIRAYESGKLGLHQLIADIEALMDCLHDPDPAWLSDFRHQWSLLEEIYAVASDRQESLSKPEFVTSIALGLERMKLRLASLKLRERREGG